MNATYFIIPFLLSWYIYLFHLAMYFVISSLCWCALLSHMWSPYTAHATLHSHHLSNIIRVQQLLRIISLILPATSLHSGQTCFSLPHMPWIKRLQPPLHLSSCDPSPVGRCPRGHTWQAIYPQEAVRFDGMCSFTLWVGTSSTLTWFSLLDCRVRVELCAIIHTYI